jgi:predicted nucleic acid-binding protein
LLDTSVLIDQLRGDERANALLADCVRQGHELWSVTVVRTEVLAGMRRGEEQATRALLDALHWQDVTVGVADRAGALAAKFLRSHRSVDTIDYVIAAAAETLGARLLTMNVRHFSMFAGLEPAYA